MLHRAGCRRCVMHAPISHTNGMAPLSDACVTALTWDGTMGARPPCTGLLAKMCSVFISNLPLSLSILSKLTCIYGSMAIFYKFPCRDFRSVQMSAERMDVNSIKIPICSIQKRTTHISATMNQLSCAKWTIIPGHSSQAQT
jgi:hypothetical protein